jgi:hypothetical protein
MSVIPRKFQDFLAFCQNHAPTWSAQAANIGIAPMQATAFSTLVGTLNTAYQAHISAQNAARNATIALNDTTATTRAAAADLLRLIKAFAENSATPNTVYAKADIPPPATPAPAEPPGQPTNFKAALQPEGFLSLTWKALNPSGLGGTVWTVRRKLATESAWTIVGATGLRKFTDETLPLGGGGGEVQYVVQGQRAQSVGLPSTPFVVQFGVGGGGGGLTIASQFMAGDAGNVPAKLAA